jgi:hypothetical protein
MNRNEVIDFILETRYCREDLSSEYRLELRHELNLTSNDYLQKECDSCSNLLIK